MLDDYALMYAQSVKLHYRWKQTDCRIGVSLFLFVFYLIITKQ